MSSNKTIDLVGSSRMRTALLPSAHPLAVKPCNLSLVPVGSERILPSRLNSDSGGAPAFSAQAMIETGEAMKQIADIKYALDDKHEAELPGAAAPPPVQRP